MWMRLLLSLWVPLLAFIVATALIDTHHGGGLSQCESNMKNIGTALEMYATDNDGHYPLHLDQLTPNYLKLIPTCPSAGTDTYSESYICNRTPPRVVQHRQTERRYETDSAWVSVKWAEIMIAADRGLILALALLLVPVWLFWVLAGDPSLPFVNSMEGLFIIGATMQLPIISWYDNAAVVNLECAALLGTSVIVAAVWVAWRSRGRSSIVYAILSSASTLYLCSHQADGPILGLLTAFTALCGWGAGYLLREK